MKTVSNWWPDHWWAVWWTSFPYLQSGGSLKAWLFWESNVTVHTLLTMNNWNHSFPQMNCCIFNNTFVDKNPWLPLNHLHFISWILKINHLTQALRCSALSDNALNNRLYMVNQWILFPNLHRARPPSRSTSCPRLKAPPPAPSPTARQTCLSNQTMWRLRGCRPTSLFQRWDGSVSDSGSLLHESCSYELIACFILFKSYILCHCLGPLCHYSVWFYKFWMIVIPLPMNNSCERGGQCVQKKTTPCCPGVLSCELVEMLHVAS